MKDNTPHVPGSTRSCRNVLSRSATPPRCFRPATGKCVHYAYKMRPNFKTQILINSLSTTYAFNTRKCTHFHNASSRPIANQSPASESQDARLGRLVERDPFSLGEKVGMRDKPVPFYDRSTWQRVLWNTVQNETKRDEKHSFENLRAPYQPLTTTTRPAVPCSGAVADEVTSSVVGSKSNETDFRGYSCGVRYTHHHPLCSLTI